MKRDAKPFRKRISADDDHQKSVQFMFGTGDAGTDIEDVRTRRGRNRRRMSVPIADVMIIFIEHFEDFSLLRADRDGKNAGTSYQ